MPLPGRGVDLAVTDWGGEGPVALCAHANGFCGALWHLVAAELAGHVRVVALDLRGHGGSSSPPPGPAYAWGELADDVVALGAVLLDTLGLGRFDLGVGNSVGGTAVLGAAVRDADLFGALALVDPVVLPRERYAHPEHSPSRLVEGALRRRRTFASREAVVEAYAGRPLFAEWQPEAIRLYARHAFRATGDGEVELCCDPEVEASVFRNAATMDPFALAPSLGVPGLVLHARDSFAGATYVELVELAPSLVLVDLPAPHLAPMTHPALVAAHVRDALRLAG